ncbi:vegetative incompatibility het-e-1 [Fusarium sporotrichioides]|uniref:Vegetative incompatibility het-e-1 n=1 Tax=Fusarium sporotrichioides TaxID=5514 RepID=A0A395S4N2_FUSSP|nr:vegetative incompatibility het-e-1 [Fusarium sporotrichioides]
MASPQGLKLERSMDQFRRELTDDQKKEISGANRKAITHEIEKLQAKVGSQGGLCKLSRMYRFLDTMEEVEKLVSIFLNVSEVVAFIWGPIKLVLMVAATWTKSVKNIIDVYEEIAVALDNLAVFHNLIRDNEQLKRMLEDYFSDILRFHRSILAVFSKPDWKRMYLFVWKEFRRNVEPIIESLKRKQAMLSDDKLQQHAILKILQDSDSYAKDHFEQMHSGLDDVLTLERLRSQEQESEKIKSCLERKLNVSLSQVSSQLELPDTVIETSGTWILSHPRFQSWKSSVSPQECVLFLNGCPGAGKSTLAKTIIRYLNDVQFHQFSPQRSVFYFFFKHNDANRRSTRSMLCHIITQIINVDQTMMRFIYDKSSSMDYLDLSFLKSLASDCLLSRRDVIIILDGLDEAKDDEPENALKWCLYELLRTAPLRGCHVRLLICGQEDGRIEPLLCSYPQIRLHTVDPHKKDIEEYCTDRASVIGTRFRLTSDDVKELIIEVSEASKVTVSGMFLYAKVVLANLASMGSRKEYKAELDGNEFPRDMDEAYERIIQRIIYAADPSARTSAKKILGWLVCSERPLRWREIQSRFCIDVERGLCDPDDLRIDSCKQLCSSLVDATDCEMFPKVESEQTITMIHETASKYLVHTNTIDLMQEHIAMSLFCCRYLCSRPFLSVGTDDFQEVIQSGYFGFMDYAAALYQSHITKAKLSRTDSASCLNINTAKDALCDLERAYHGALSNKLAEIHTTVSHSQATSQSLFQAIQDKVLNIRMAIDIHRDKLSQSTGFKELEGEKRYKCPRLHCLKFSIGYLSEVLLQQHLANHERPFRCKYESCFAYVVGYKSQGDLQRHIRNFHNEESRAKTTFPKARETRENDLIHACRSGDLRQVELFHQLGSDLQGSSLQNQPLMVAFMAGHGHICKYLLDNGVNPFQAEQESPIIRAISVKSFDMLELFLFGYRELTSSSNVHNLERCIYRVFASYRLGIDILIRLSAMKRAEGDARIIESLLATQTALVFYDRLRSPGNKGIRERKIRMFRLKEKARSRANTSTAFLELEDWRQNHTSFAIDPRVFNHSYDATPVHTEFRHMFPKLYVQNEFLPNRNYQEYRICQQFINENKLFLHTALLRNHYPLATFLMDIDNDSVMQTEDKAGNSLIHSFVQGSCEAACDGCVQMVKRLVKLDSKGLAYIPNNNGHLPLHIALGRKISPPVLRVILELPKDINHKDSRGSSPIHYAHSEESMNILLQRKAVDVFSRNKDGETCFVRFCHADMAFDEGIVRLLLAADIRLAWTADESTHRFTPLHHSMHALRRGQKNFGSYGSHRAAKFLLNLPEVEQVLLAEMTSPVTNCAEVRRFAAEESLEHALEIMDKIGFGRPTAPETDGYDS